MKLQLILDWFYFTFSREWKELCEMKVRKEVVRKNNWKY